MISDYRKNYESHERKSFLPTEVCLHKNKIFLVGEVISHNCLLYHKNP